MLKSWAIGNSGVLNGNAFQTSQVYIHDGYTLTQSITSGNSTNVAALQWESSISNIWWLCRSSFIYCHLKCFMGLENQLKGPIDMGSWCVLGWVLFINSITGKSSKCDNFTFHTKSFILSSFTTESWYEMSSVANW